MASAIAITGLGQVSALGGDVETLLDGLVAGRCAIGPLTRFSHRGRAQIAAEVDDAGLPPVGAPRRRSRSDRLAFAAAAEACRHAGLEAPDRAATAVVVGVTTAGMLEAEEAYRRWRTEPRRRARLSGFLGMPLASVGAAVAHDLGLHGPRSTVSTACSSGALAIAAASRVVARGDAAYAVALGVDVLCRLTYAGFDALQALDAEPCRPFDGQRRGLSLGEGAGALVLEDVAHARARGAPIHALLLAAGVAADAHHVTAPHPDATGAIAALRGALAQAGVPPTAVDYVNAHGSGTPHNDLAEVAALRAVFGRPRMPVSSTKSQLGHCLAAAGALEAVVTVLALERGIVPATVTLREPDAAWMDLDLVSTPGRRAAMDVAVSSSYGFGGHDVALVLARPDGRA